MNLLHLLLVVPLANPPNVVRQTDVDALWEFVQAITVPRSMPPEVYFTREEEPPTSPPFLAYYYEHTRVLRISPLAVQRGAGLGYVYMVLGHEMLHYALAGQVPVEEHHCLFVQKGYREQIAEFLVEHGIAHPALRFMDEEVDGCDPSRVPGGEPVASDGPGLTGGP